MNKKLSITLFSFIMIVIGCTSEYTEQVSTPTMIIEPTQMLTKDSSEMVLGTSPVNTPDTGDYVRRLKPTTNPSTPVATGSVIPLPTSTSLPTPSATSEPTISLETIPIPTTLETQIVIPTTPTISPITIPTPIPQPTAPPTKVATTFISQVNPNQDNLVLSSLTLSRTSLGIYPGADILSFSIKNDNNSTVAAGVSIYKRLGNQTLIVPNHDYSHLVILEPGETKRITIQEPYPPGETYLKDSSLFVETYMVSNLGLFGIYTNCDEIDPFFGSIGETKPKCHD